MKIFIMWFFVGLIIICPLLRYSLFLLSNWRSGDLRYIYTKLGGLGKPIFRGVTTAMVADVFAFATYPLVWFTKSKPEASGIPVLLVHGLFHNASAWSVFRWRLKLAGFKNLHTYQYNSFTKGFSQAVDGCERKVNDLLGDNPDARVILIGHSLGGLVCRKVAGNSLYKERVAAMVTLGSPHKGSDLAWLGGTKMARDLIPGRATSASIEAVSDPDCPKLGIYTLVDDFIFPLGMLKTDRPDWQEQICSPMGHVWMVYSREVADRVIRFLRFELEK
jgi:triacylglycerol esterase/lipase EstA (alpha/beta hydrolase family)